MIFGSFHQGKALQYYFQQLSNSILNSASYKSPYIKLVTYNKLKFPVPIKIITFVKYLIIKW
jgi:hypothetical protein